MYSEAAKLFEAANQHLYCCLRHSKGAQQGECSKTLPAILPWSDQFRKSQLLVVRQWYSWPSTSYEYLMVLMRLNYCIEVILPVSAWVNVGDAEAPFSATACCASISKHEHHGEAFSNRF